MAFLPICKEDMEQRGWEDLDFIFVTGEAYVDHPSFGHAIITRLLEDKGYRVGIISLPQKKEDYLKLGIPQIAFIVSSGVIDSMVNNYTVAKKKRTEDEYAPGGKAGLRPDRADIIYCKKIKEYCGDIPIIIGGIEASLRRFAHYDYWEDKVKNSIIIDTEADLLIYGMGEKPWWDICKYLEKGIPINKIRNVAGSVYADKYENLPKNIKEAIDKNEFSNNIKVLEDSEEVKKDKQKYAKCFKIQYEEQDFKQGSILIQKHGNKYVVQNIPQKPLSEKELDSIYKYPYERTYHPIYESEGGVPSIKEVEFSITAQRGCFGACNFCAITFHQGRIIQPRSDESIIEEAELLASKPNFKGYIHDVGGPTANFRHPSCKKQLEHGMCKGKECLYPKPCPNLNTDHSGYLNLLRKVRKIKGIKKVFIRSGIRYDYLMLDKNDEFFIELCKYHVSGQLKVAPEHIVDEVLDKMGKPKSKVYLEFADKYYQINKKLGKEQFLVPYLISSHPGCDIKSAIKLTEYLKQIHYMPMQVQDFYPTPGTISTCMFYTGIDPRTMEKVYVPKQAEEKRMQRALLQYRKKENYQIIKQALKTANREDLIGFKEHCIVKPLKEEAVNKNKQKDSIKKVKKKTIRNVHKKKK